jgi:hypothetical protein
MGADRGLEEILHELDLGFVQASWDVQWWVWRGPHTP